MSRLMGKPLPCLLLCLFLQAWHVQAQSIVSSPTSYVCSDGPSSCHTFVFYRAQAPHFLTLDSISDLFGVSKLMIARASNLMNENSALVEGQSLLVPVTCGCMGNVSQANITYQINGDDTFYLVSTRNFENLTTYQAVEAANPELDPFNIPDGTNVVFPIRCKCPTKAQLEKGIRMLITYVVHKDDTMVDISRNFSANLQHLVSENGRLKVGNSSTILIPVSQKPTLSQPVDSVVPSVTPVYVLVSPEHVGGDSNRGLSIGLSMAVAVGLLVVGLVFGVLRRKKRSSKLAKVCQDQKQSPCPKMKSFDRNASAQEELLAGVLDCLDKPLMYTPEVLREATQNFSPLFNIQGSVYRGTINGSVVAIKQMKGDVSEELRLLQKVNHGNLVRLEGFCISPEGQCYLIYEYAENGSLNVWLNSSNHRPSGVLNNCASSLSSSILTWKLRLQIALDIASGLQYMHEHTTPSVVHKDLKSSNILLNSKLRAKIANFGMAKSGINALTKHIKGTQGYMAPEYLTHGLVTPKLDVFAFGVILLELISGKEAIVKDGGGVPIAGKAGLLWTQIRPLLEGEDREVKLRKWMDPILHNSYHIDSALTLAILARACVEEDVRARPTMGEIVYKLSKLLEVCFEHYESSWTLDQSIEIATPIAGR
eukprot:Gb_09694 [translate_table: standard]